MENTNLNIEVRSFKVMQFELHEFDSDLPEEQDNNMFIAMECVSTEEEIIVDFTLTHEIFITEDNHKVILKTATIFAIKGKDLDAMLDSANEETIRIYSELLTNAISHSRSFLETQESEIQFYNQHIPMYLSHEVSDKIREMMNWGNLTNRYN